MTKIYFKGFKYNLSQMFRNRTYCCFDMVLLLSQVIYFYFNSNYFFTPQLLWAFHSFSTSTMTSRRHGRDRILPRSAERLGSGSGSGSISWGGIRVVPHHRSGSPLHQADRRAVVGRSMAATERHLWVNLADIVEKEKGFLLDAPVSPVTIGMYGKGMAGQIYIEASTLWSHRLKLCRSLHHCMKLDYSDLSSL